MRSRARLAQAIPLLDANLEAIPHREDELPAAGRGTRVDPPQRREVILIHGRLLAQGEDDGGRHVEEGQAVVLDQLAGFSEVPFWHYYAAGAGHEADVYDDAEALEETGFSLELGDERGGTYMMADK